MCGDGTRTGRGVILDLGAWRMPIAAPLGSELGLHNGTRSNSVHEIIRQCKRYASDGGKEESIHGSDDRTTNPTMTASMVSGRAKPPLLLQARAGKGAVLN